MSTKSTTSSAVRTQRGVPQRTCVGCRTTGAKRELIRVVNTPERGVEVDLTSKANGRGAYVCSNRGCWEQALMKDRLGRALRTQIPAKTREDLERFGASLPTPEAAVKE